MYHIRFVCYPDKIWDLQKTNVCRSDHRAKAQSAEYESENILWQHVSDLAIPYDAPKPHVNRFYAWYFWTKDHGRR
jgi:hypothetical protein